MNHEAETDKIISNAITIFDKCGKIHGVISNSVGKRETVMEVFNILGNYYVTMTSALQAVDTDYNGDSDITKAQLQVVLQHCYHAHNDYVQWLDEILKGLLDTNTKIP